MGSVTLIGSNLAKEGLKFRFGGCLSRCQNCELKNSCCGLEKNKWYKVVNVREKEHDCNVHQGNVKVVDVEPALIKTTAKEKSVIQGSVIKLEDKECDHIECKNYRLCHPPGIEFGNKYNVKEVEENIDCKLGKDLKLVKLE